MYGTIVYNLSAATAGQENSFDAATDPDITQQNSHYIFTGDYRLLAATLVGASVEYGRYDVAEWNGRGQFNIQSANRGLTPVANPEWDTYFSQQLMLPKNQELLIHATNNLGSSTEIESVIMQICTPDWSKNAPAGLWDIMLHMTVTATPTANAWKESLALAFDSNPLGGVYVVLGAMVIGDHSSAWRLNFPRGRMYGGRRLRPGGLLINTYGNQSASMLGDKFAHWGVLGAFHTFEPPTLGLFGTAATSTTYDVFLKCRFLGQQVSLLDQFVQTNY